MRTTQSMLFLIFSKKYIFKMNLNFKYRQVKTQNSQKQPKGTLTNFSQISMINCSKLEIWKIHCYKRNLFSYA